MDWLAIFSTIASNRFVRIAAATFAISSAFLLGMIIRLGFATLPLIDKGQLLVQLAIYASFLALGVQLNLLFFRQVFEVLSFLFSHRWALIILVFIVSMGLGALLIVFFPFLSGIFNIIQNMLDDIFDIVSKIMIVISLVLAILPLSMSVSFKHSDKKEEATIRISFTSFFASLVLLCAIGAGALWTVFLEYGAPRQKILMSVGEINASIILQGADGVLTYMTSEPGVHFIPWHRINRINIIPWEWSPSSLDAEGQ